MFKKKLARVAAIFTAVALSMSAAQAVPPAALSAPVPSVSAQPCWFRIPGKYQILNLSQVSNVFAEDTGKGTFHVYFLSPGLVAGRPLADFDTNTQGMNQVFNEILETARSCR